MTKTKLWQGDVSYTPNVDRIEKAHVRVVLDNVRAVTFSDERLTYLRVEILDHDLLGGDAWRGVEHGGTLWKQAVSDALKAMAEDRQ